MLQPKQDKLEVASRLAFYAALVVVGIALVIFAAQKPPARFLAIDTIQHLSVARNLTHGAGLATSVIYYAVQYSFATIPAPQTVWPPGAAVSAAALGAVGVDLADAFVVFSAASVLGASAILFATLRRCGVRASFAAPAATIWAASPSTWHFAIRGETEAPFVLFCWLCFYVVIRAATSSEKRLHLWVLAGGCAALALAWRYQGVYLGPALVAVAIMATQARPWPERLGTLAALVGPMCLALLAIALRNISLTGALTGVHGVIIDPLSLVGAIKYASWFTERSLADLIGIRPSPASRLILVVSLVVTGWVMVRVYRATRSSSATHGAPPTIHRVRALAAVMAAGFAIVALTHMFIGAITTATWYFAGVRYITILMPSLIFFLALGGELVCRPIDVGASAAHPPLKVLIGTLSAWLLVLWVLAAAATITGKLRATTSEIEDALSTSTLGGGTVGDFIEANDARLRPMLASWAHELHLLDSKPVIGLQPTSTSLAVWDFDRMLALCDALGVRSVLVVESHLAPPRDDYTENQVALRELAAGKQHPRLRLALEASGVKLFEVLPPPGLGVEGRDMHASAGNSFRCFSAEARDARFPSQGDSGGNRTELQLVRD